MCIGPITQKEKLVAHALEIAMDYLERTGQAEDFRYVQAAAMGAILKAYFDGVHHRIALANRAIVAIEKPASSQNVVSMHKKAPHS
jgi:hypothetical protein